MPLTSPECRAGVSPAQRARQREQGLNLADLGRRDTCPTLIQTWLGVTRRAILFELLNSGAPRLRRGVRTFNVLYRSPRTALSPALSHPMGEGESFTRLLLQSPQDFPMPTLASLSHRMEEGQGQGSASRSGCGEENTPWHAVNSLSQCPIRCDH
jgi:hypothetical protein